MRPRAANDRSTIHGQVFARLMDTLKGDLPVVLTRYDSQGAAGEITARGRRFRLVIEEIRETTDAR